MWVYFCRRGCLKSRYPGKNLRIGKGLQSISTKRSLFRLVTLIKTNCGTNRLENVPTYQIICLRFLPKSLFWLLAIKVKNVAIFDIKYQVSRTPLLTNDKVGQKLVLWSVKPVSIS